MTRKKILFFCVLARDRCFIAVWPYRGQRGPKAFAAKARLAAATAAPVKGLFGRVAAVSGELRLLVQILPWFAYAPGRRGVDLPPPLASAEGDDFTGGNAEKNSNLCRCIAYLTDRLSPGYRLSPGSRLPSHPGNSSSKCAALN